MHKSTFSRDGAFDEEVIFCLERQMIPAWERDGLEHLAISAPTMREFNAQAPPQQISTWKKKWVGRKWHRAPAVVAMIALSRNGRRMIFIRSVFPS